MQTVNADNIPAAPAFLSLLPGGPTRGKEIPVPAACGMAAAKDTAVRNNLKEDWDPASEAGETVAGPPKGK